MQAIREALDIPPRSPLPTRPPTHPPTLITTPRPSSYRAAVGCGNDLCEVDETNKNCPNDCISAQLDTTPLYQSMASSAESIKFAIMAKRVVAIKSLSFYTRTARNSEVTVKTQEGQYSRGIFSDLATDGWTTVFHGQVVTRGYDSGGAQLTTVEFDHHVVVSAGKTQSFEVHTVSSRIMVQLGGREGMLTGQDTALEVRVRRSGAQSPAAFGGIIEYDGLDDGSNAGGRSKSAKAKTAKLEKEDVLFETGEDEGYFQAESDWEEEAIALDPVRADVKALDDKVGALDDKVGALDDTMGALDDKMGALEEGAQSIKADVKTLDDKMKALETKLGSIEGMMTHIVQLLEASSDVEEKAVDGATN